MASKRQRKKKIVAVGPIEVEALGKTPVILKVKKLYPESVLPTIAYEGDACFDLQSVENIDIEPLQTQIVKTGLAYEIPTGYMMSIAPRSGISMNFRSYLANSPSTIDAGYRNEVFLLVCNNTFNKTMSIKQGDRIAQARLERVIPFKFEEVEELSPSERGLKGLGSSGVHDEYSQYSEDSKEGGTKV